MGAITFFNLQEIIKEFKCLTFVETGTGKGDGLYHASLHPFNRLYSVEIIKEAVDELTEVFAPDRRISITCGESGEFIANLVKDLAEEPVLFWLDSHFPGADYGTVSYFNEQNLAIRLPLLRELETIGGRLAKGVLDVIIIDDLRIYEKADYPAKNLDEIDLGGLFNPFDLTNYVKEIFGKTHIIDRIIKDTGYLVITPK